MKKIIFLSLLLILLFSFQCFSYSYSGDFDGITGNIVTDYYNVTMRYGTLLSLFYTYHNETYNWLRTDDVTNSGSRVGEIFSGGWRMAGGITTTKCDVDNSSSLFLFVNCSNSGAKNNWSFYPSYIKLESTYTSNYRVYSYINSINSTSRIYNSTSSFSGISDWSTRNFNAGTSGMIPYYPNNHVFAWVWDESLKTVADLVTRYYADDWMGVAKGRSSEITANTWMTGYFKVLEHNGTHEGTREVLNAFKEDPLYGDPCIYSGSGNWLIENAICEITESYDLGGNNITFSNSTITLSPSAMPTNFRIWWRGNATKLTVKS